MKKQRSKDILFFIENEVQFDSVKPLLMYLRDNTKISFDIVVPIDEDNKINSNIEIYNNGAIALENNGFSIFRGIDRIVVPEIIKNTSYKIQFSAYMYFWHYENLNVKYRIMFPYASYYFNKPNWTISQFIQQDYLADALISHAVGTKPVTDIFTKTYVLPPLKLTGYKKQIVKKDKPVILFAPTYNEIDFAIKILESIDDLKEKYTFIVRGHQKISQVDSNKEIIEKLYKKADKVYDIDEYSIAETFSNSDIVISDNSGVIFDAIYCKIPVVLFSRDNNSFKYKDINTKQHELVKNGVLFWTNNPRNLLNLIDKTLSDVVIKKQEEIRRLLFPIKKLKDPVKEWIDMINIYLNDEIPYEYFFVKKYWVQRISSRELNKRIESLNNQLINRDGQIKMLNNQIAFEKNPGIKILFKRIINSISLKYKIHKDD